MALSEESAKLSLGLIHIFASPDLDSDGIDGARTRLAHTENLLLRSRERKENHVVLIGSTRRLSFPIEHADDRERHTADPDRPTDRIGVAEEIHQRRLPDQRDIRGPVVVLGLERSPRR